MDVLAVAGVHERMHTCPTHTSASFYLPCAHLARQGVEEVRDEAAARDEEGQHVGLLDPEGHGAAGLKARLQLVPAPEAGAALERAQRGGPQGLGRLADAPGVGWVGLG